jgi:ketosteroid isomerase-like protein
MSCAHQGELRASDRTAIRAAIERQLDAFRRDDAASAFAFASPAIQAEFATPEDFLTAVKTFYEPVYRPRRTGGFTNLYVIDGQLTQPVLLVGPSGDFVVALYTMQKQPDGEWKILGCSLIL